MYVIATYDIPEDNIRNKVRKSLRKYLTHQQFSVFEGNITEKNLQEMRENLSKIISDSTGGVMIYEFWNENTFERHTLGNAEKEETTII